MDLNAYHNALNQGFSEREAEKIGEDAWEENEYQRMKYEAAQQREYDQGENPPLTDSDREAIRKHAHRIHGGGVPLCSNCGSVVNIPAGSCGVCLNCGCEIGGCSV